MNRLLRSAAIALALLAAGTRAPALGPHEVALLVNDDSPRSVEVANHFIQLRKIPQENVIHLKLPPRVMSPLASLTRDEFTRLIWEPANQAIRDRKLEDHVLAWVYSADFPVLIEGTPEVSLLGLTFVHNHLPDAESIRAGRYTSLLFAGPGQDSDRASPSRSLEQYAAFLQTNMPLPSMMLGHTGSRGLSVSGLIDLLRFAVRADGTMPRGDVAFVVSSDVRSTCRSWQYAHVAEELKALGVQALVSSNAPGPPHRLVGFMTGASYADPAQVGVFVPGSVAENLTSYAGNFSYPDQTKLTAWLRAGATASAGTVTEPYAIWTKFPHARFFTHYVAGCSVIEAYFQALVCPLQIQLMGDPLARPWGKPPGMTLVDLNDEGKPLTGTGEFLASSWAGPFDPPPVLLFLLDGRAVTSPPNQPQLRIDTTALNDGYHELRAVAYTQGQVRQQGFDVRGFTVRNHGRSVRIAGLAVNDAIDLNHVRPVAVDVEGGPREISLTSQGRELVRQPYKDGQALALDPRQLGAGPNRIQAVAWYENGERVCSAPVPLRVDRLNEFPAIESIARTNTSDHEVVLAVTATDAERDAVSVTWWEDLGFAKTPLEPFGGRCERTNASWSLAATGAWVAATAPDTRGQRIREIAAEVRIPRADQALPGQLAGVVFDFRSAGNFSFFGWSGPSSSWILGSYAGGKMVPDVAIGAFLEPDRWYRIRVRETADRMVEALVDDEYVARRKQNQMDGPVGLVGGSEPSEARGLYVSPPPYPADQFRIRNDEATLRDGVIPQGLSVRAEDGVGGRFVRVNDRMKDQ